MRMRYLRKTSCFSVEKSDGMEMEPNATKLLVPEEVVTVLGVADDDVDDEVVVFHDEDEGGPLLESTPCFVFAIEDG
jgi:hypothetical protein